MGRKKRDMSCLRPFCFYCDKSFKNEVILHHHQKAKHFSCPKCPKKFSSIDSMSHHCRTHHELTIERVPNSNVGREHPGLKIFGMQGVPRIEIESWISKQVNKYWGKRIDKKIEADRKAQQERKQKIEQEAKDKVQPEESKQMEQEEEGFNLDMPLELKFDE